MTTWQVEIGFLDDSDHTQAIAVLKTPDGRELRGLGQSKRNPGDRPVTEIGEEVAGARALSSLAHELLNYAASQIEKNVRRGDPVV
ncbi:MAG TPA: DUF1876 domain-containing protein [Micromonosporaceae bacterium]|nr:DUF1876 domain-containing protein [Micromonosporaceae bacterium]HCU48956.1 DUF1876 domain-containing protein [Micromonosporaceae bacterium]